LKYPRYAKKGVPAAFDVVSDKHHQHFIICSSIGHLYGLVDSTKRNREVYPVLDLEWAPISSKKRGESLALKASQIIEMISDISRKATKFVHACDYDQEGEVIGYNILEYACKHKYEKSLRAKFSTLTAQEISESFANLLKPNKGLAEAGRSRHILDFIYGVNLSRALSQSFKVGYDSKKEKRRRIYYNLSIGRVQGPTLAFVVDKEIVIRKHIPHPYWIITAKFEKNGQEIIEALYEKEKIETLSEARSIVSSCTGKDGFVSELKNQKMTLSPPTPFSLSDLQRETYRLFKVSPTHTLLVAERLYLDALISYPRTSSQKVPDSIGYKKIISGLSKINNEYNNMARVLLSKDHLSPNEGVKTDLAHPAIYPTGERPRRKLDWIEFKIYDLIVRRFFATFGDPAISQRVEVSITVNSSYIFKTVGRTKIYEGWIYFYKPYFRFEEVQLPELQQGDVLKNILIKMEEKFTQPPFRFNQVSLLKKMEKEEIGTKATRTDIINTLFKRNYIANTVQIASQKGHNGIQATDLGFAVIESMRECVPDIVSIDLTRSMEKQLEMIEAGESNSTSVIEYAVDKLIESLALFRERGSSISQQLTDAIVTTVSKEKSIGICPVCHKGELRIIKSRITKKRFVGCSNYSSSSSTGICKATAPLPQKGSIKTTGKNCIICKWPIINVIFAHQRKNPWKICINMQCPLKNKIKEEDRKF
jgi:DNA topoisomerase-1